MDNKAVKLPLGIKLKPIRRKVEIRDCIKHGKQRFYKALAGETWRTVLNANDVDQAVSTCKTVSSIYWHK